MKIFKSLFVGLVLLFLLLTVDSNAQDPSVQAYNVAIAGRGQSSLGVTWTRGNGEKCLVVCKPAANAYSYPSDGANNDYVASSAYGSGDNLGNNNFVVYDGTGTSVTISGLASSTQYTIVVYEYNIVNGLPDIWYYKTTVTTSNYESAYTLCTGPTTNATNLAAGSVTYTSATLSWTTGNSTYTLCAVDNYSTGSSYMAPTDGTAYTANSVYGSGSLLTGDNRVVYNSTGTSVSVTNLLPATTYRATTFEFCGSSTGSTWNYMTNSGDDVYFTTLNNQPTLNAISNVTVCQNSASTGVSLSGISDGSSQETQNLTVTATSSNTTLIPNGNISISYTSPNTTGTLSFTPATNQYGSSTITVTVNDGFSMNNTVVRTFLVTVNPIPGSSGSINGNYYVCKNGNDYVFTCSAATNATGYVWSFPSGTVVTSGGNTNNITVNFPSSMIQTSGNITVYATNGFGCGNGATSSRILYFDALPTVASAGADQIICNGTTQLEGNDPSPNYGYWSTLDNATFIDANDPTTNVTGINSGDAVTLTYTIYSDYGACPNSTDDVVIDYDPTNPQCLIYSDFIASTTTPCLNTSMSFTDNSVGATSYNWNFGAGATPPTSTATNPTVIYTTPGLHSVTLTVTGPNGNDTETKTNYINVLDVPSNAGAIMGLTTVCAGDDQIIYSVGTINNATNYDWVLPSGASINSGTGTNAISVNYDVNATSGAITVQGQNVCGNGGISTLNITVNPLPANAGSISGDVTVCQGENGVIYTVPVIANATTYNWTLPTGSSIAVNNNNSITVDFSTSAISGDFIVYGTNSCGNGVSDTLSIVADPLPGAAGAITGALNITNCPSSTSIEYAIDSVANATSYLWSTPSGSNIVAGNNTDTIMVDFNFGASSGNISVIPQNACGNGTSNSLPIIVDDPVSQNICLVTVDDNSTHNQIVWEKNETPVLASYNIYREVTTGVYNLIANVHKDSLSMYDDLTADPNVTSYSYKITALDTCGNESPQSEFHNTIHLQFLGNGNLQWTLYDIENQNNPVDFYEVFRDDSSTGAWNSISNTIPGGNSTFTDVDYALFSNPSYRVDVIWTIGCDPTRAGVNTSRSNVKNAPASGVSVEEMNELNAIRLYPNPANTFIQITGLKNNARVSFYNSIGQMLSDGNTSNNEIISIEDLPNGFYTVKIESGNHVKTIKLIKN